MKVAKPGKAVFEIPNIKKENPSTGELLYKPWYCRKSNRPYLDSNPRSTRPDPVKETHTPK